MLCPTHEIQDTLHHSSVRAVDLYRLLPTAKWTSCDWTSPPFPLPPSHCPLEDQHRVPITVEPIPLLHRFTVRPKHPLAAGECGDEHQQRRARQMKVRDHRVDELKSVTRVDEQRRLAAAGKHVAVRRHGQ